MKLNLRILALASLGMLSSTQTYASVGTVTTFNGKQYIIVDDTGRVKAQAGQGVVLIGTNGYVDDITSSSTYAKDYLDTSAATANATALTAVTALKETTQITENVQARIAEVLDGQASGARLAMGTSSNQQGMASGGNYARTGIWLNPAYTHISDSNAATHFKGNLFTGSLGADYKYSDRSLAGLSFSYGHLGDGKTAANQGKYKHDSLSVSPYFAYRFNEMFGIDALVGYSRLNKKTDKANLFTFAGTPRLYDGTRIKGKTHANRWFGGIFGTARKSFDRLNLSLRVGYLHLRERQKAFKETNGNQVAAHTYKLGNVSARLRAGFRMTQSIEPFVQGGVNNYVNATKVSFPTGPKPKKSNTGYMVGGGLNLFSANSRIKGGVEVEHDRNKTLKATTVSARVRCEM